MTDQARAALAKLIQYSRERREREQREAEAQSQGDGSGKDSRE